MFRVPAASLLLLLAAHASPPPPDAGGWGRDINPGQGKAILEEARPGLVAILRASAADRPARIEEFTGKARWTSEAWKRFRNPELKPLFLRLLDDPDWHAAHRALFALEAFGGDDVLAKAWALQFHAEPRLREKAAITCIRTWTAKGAKNCSQGDWKGALASLLDTEPDPHVRACFEALRRRAEGRLPLLDAYEEFRVKARAGRRWPPVLGGLGPAKTVAPGYAPKGVSQSGGGGKIPVAAAWTTPLLGYGAEEVAGTSLQPFANPRENGVVHTGQDVGACMDGSGYYASAEGVVRFVHSGSDMGTLLVLEHRLDAKRTVCAVYMHGGDTVFVKGGERVAAGQLIGTMGMGFSLENGGHFAHLHFGLYPGPFEATHNYGYKKKADGLLDWLDPATRLPLWRDLGALPEGGDLATAVAIVARANRAREAGYPGRAKGIAEEGRKRFKPADGGKGFDDLLDAWNRDPKFTRALKGEPKVEALEAAFWAPASRPSLVEKRAAAHAPRPADYSDTDLAPRLR